MKTHNCLYCNENFLNITSYNKHIRKIHSDKLKYQCKMCGDGFYYLRHLFKHLSTTHNNQISNKQYFENYIEKQKCVICNKLVDFENLKYAPCCGSKHYQQTKKSQKEKINENIICKICNDSFCKISGLVKHLQFSHNYNKNQLKEYYDIYYKKSNEGVCKWCGKKTEFSSMKRGYYNFCYNTICNISWYNKNNNRAKNCADKISSSLKTNQNLKSQKGYWIKNGFTEEQAKFLVKERQSTNSIKSIVKRNNCTIAEATDIRKQITEKWLNNFPRLNFSLVSQKLFWSICKDGNLDPCKSFFASNNNGQKDFTKNREYRIKTKTTCYALDFYVPLKNKCIEFDGVYWHGIGRGNKTDYQKRETNILESYPNLQIMHVREDEYNMNKEIVTQKCIQFLNS